MTSEGRITLASNRGPVSFVESEGGFATKRGAGGLAGALDPVARRLGDDALWVAAATSATDRQAIEAGMVAQLRSELGYRVELLDIEPDVYAAYYDEVSNRALWFANHCLWEEAGVDPGTVMPEGSWSAYERVNRRFAEVVADQGAADALVLFQDYHLSLAPHDLRLMAPQVASLHFTHSSFCGFEGGLGRLSPSPLFASEVVTGMLGADLVGFHEPRWAANFLDCCGAVGFEVDLGSGTVSGEGRKSWVRCYPIPIDAPDLVERARGEATKGWSERHIEWAAGRAVIVRADRMEPSKNIVRGFEAFGAMLDADASLRDRVCFIACVYPSRQNMPEYRLYGQRIEQVVTEVNERHPDSIALFTEDDFDRSLGALKVYDVLLVNPIMDGMNLVSKEGPALNDRDGVLVLSRGAGSFGEMSPGAIVIDDAYDVNETAARMKQAVELSEPDRARLATAARGAATAREPEHWIDAQIHDLAAISSGDAPSTSWKQPSK